MTRISARLAALLAIAAVLLPMTAAQADVRATVTNATGPTVVNEMSGNPFLDPAVTVRVQGVQTHGGTLSVTLDVSGLDSSYAGQTFGAHVHVNPCGSNPSDPLLGAGGHYKNTSLPADDPEAREVWLDFIVTGNGTGHAHAERPWTFTSSAQSVVIHAHETDSTGAAGARWACTTAIFHS